MFYYTGLQCADVALFAVINFVLKSFITNIIIITTKRHTSPVSPVSLIILSHTSTDTGPSLLVANGNGSQASSPLSNPSLKHKTVMSYAAATLLPGGRNMFISKSGTIKRVVNN